MSSKTRRFALVPLVLVATLSAHRARAAQIQAPLNYNLDAIYHGTGTGPSTDDTQYQSISDRGLIWNGSTVPNGNTPYVSAQGLQNFTSAQTGLAYTFVSTANTLDTVALTPRSGLPNNENYTTNTTTLSSPVLLGSNSAIGVLYNYSNGGGTYNMTLNFANASPLSVTLSANDWAGGGAHAPSAGVYSQTIVSQAGFGNGSGNVDAVQGIDSPSYASGVPLQVTEAYVTAASLLTGLGTNVKGDILESITFNGLNGASAPQSAAGIYAVTLTGTMVPEPSSIVLCALASLGLLVVSRRRGRRTAR